MVASAHDWFPACWPEGQLRHDQNRPHCRGCILRLAVGLPLPPLSAFAGASPVLGASWIPERTGPRKLSRSSDMKRSAMRVFLLAQV